MKTSALIIVGIALILWISGYGLAALALILISVPLLMAEEKKVKSAPAPSGGKVSIKVMREEPPFPTVVKLRPDLPQSTSWFWIGNVAGTLATRFVRKVKRMLWG